MKLQNIARLVQRAVQVIIKVSRNPARLPLVIYDD
jgi:hypothetical protein